MLQVLPQCWFTLRSPSERYCHTNKYWLVDTDFLKKHLTTHLNSKCDWAAISLHCLHTNTADYEAELLWCLPTKAKLLQPYSLLPKTKPGIVLTNQGIKAVTLDSGALL